MELREKKTCYICKHFNFIDLRCFKRYRRTWKTYAEVINDWCVLFKELKMDKPYENYKPYQQLSKKEQKQFKQFIKEAISL